VAGDEWKTVTLKNLQSFYHNPCRFFVEKRLEFKLPEDTDLLQEEEPFSVDGLEAYHCKQEVLDAIFDKKSRSQLLAVWKGSGQLPPGPAGSLVANDLFAKARPVETKIQKAIGQAQRTPRRFDLSAGKFKLEGQLLVFPGVGLVHYRAAKVERKSKGAAHLSLWIEHLLLQLTGWDGPKRSYLIGEDESWTFNEVTNAEEILCDLLDVYLKGLAAPLPFFPKTSFVYALGPGPRSAKSPEELALEAWEGNEDDEFGEGEMEDPYFNLCFRNHSDPLGEEFQRLADQVVKPLVTHETES
jgi:exodeoxyribonuclease V gamma subunit